MPIAATQESSGAINVINFSLALVKWDIFLKDLTPRAMLLEDILTFILTACLQKKAFKYYAVELKVLKKLARNIKSALRWHCYY